MPSPLRLLVLLALCPACHLAPARPSAPPEPGLRPPTAQQSMDDDPFPIRRRPGLPWEVSQALMHGFVGATSYSKVEAADGAVEGDRGDVDQLPLIGGGAQWKLGGRRVDLGLEGLLSLAGRANAAAFAVGGGGAVVAIDVDLYLLEFFGGPFASVFLGDKLRLYGGVGPLVQFADYQQSGNGMSDDGSGFGVGWYARTGLELVLPNRSLIGLGVRWSATRVDLGGSLDTLDIEGIQGVLTVSRGL